MVQLLWIGCLESEEEFKIKAQKGYNLASAQVSQKNLMNGIENVSGLVFDSINGSVLPPYPVYQDRIVTPVEWSHVENAFDISIGYRNDKYINRITCKHAMLKAADNWIRERYQGGELIVFVYSMRSASMATACRIKKLIPKAKIFLIITDLPQFMDLGESRLKAALKKIDWQSIKKMQADFDGFILYASKMAEFLQIPDGKWLLMEGSYDVSESFLEDIYEKEDEKKAIIYSGKLDEQYGINLLVDAFMSIPDADIELWLTGGGNAEAYIKKSAEKDRRIKFFGFLPFRSDVLAKQKKASLLVNMRLPSEPASNYCFPSKLFEYMVTGIPVLSFKLGGIPEDYNQYLLTIENENDIKNALKKALSMNSEQRNEIGLAAKKYVLNNKSKEIQAKRIVDFVELEK